MAGGIKNIYVEIDANMLPLQQTMTRVKGLVRESATDISQSLNGALDVKQVQAGLNQLVRNLKTLATNANASGDSFSKVGVDLKEVQAITGMTAEKFRALQQRMLQTSAQAAAARAFENLRRQTGMTAAELEALGVKAVKMPEHLQRTTSASKNTASAFGSLSRAAATLGITFSAITLERFVESTQEARREMIAISRAFETLRGGTKGAADEIEYLRKMSDSLGQNFYDVAPAFKGLTAAGQEAGWSIGELRELFQGTLQASTAMGLSSERVGGILLAFQQIISKGVVSMEEARRQLGEHLPGSMNILAKAAGLPLDAFYRLVESGNASADILKELGPLFTEMFGEAAKKAATDSIAIWNRWEQATKDLKVAIGDELAPTWDSWVQGMTQWIQANKTQVADVIGGIAGGVTALTGALADNAGVIGTTIGVYAALRLGMKATEMTATGLFATLKAHPYVLIATAAIAAVTAFDALTTTTKEASQAFSESSGRATDAANGYRAAKSALEQTSTAVNNYQEALAAANGDQEAEWKAVNQMAAFLPGFSAKYLTLAEAKVEVARRTAELVAQQEREANQANYEALTAAAKAAEDARVAIGKLSEDVSTIERIIGAAGDSAVVAFGAMRVQGVDVNDTMDAISASFSRLAAEAETWRQIAPDSEQAAALTQMVDGMRDVGQRLSDIKNIANYSGGDKLGFFRKVLFGDDVDVAALVAMLNKELDASEKAWAKYSQSATDSGKALATAQLEVEKIIIGAREDSLAKTIVLLDNELAIEKAKLAEKLNAKKLSEAEYRQEIEALALTHSAKIAAAETVAARNSAEERQKIAEKLHEQVLKLSEDEFATKDRLLNEQAAAYAGFGGKITDIAAYIAAIRTDYWRQASEAAEAALEKEVDASYKAMGLNEEAIKKYLDGSKSVLDQLFEKWSDTDSLISDSTKAMLEGVQSSFANTISSGLKGEFDSLGDAWESLMDSFINVFSNMIAQILSIWAISNIASLFNVGGGLSLGNIFSNIFGQSSSKGNVGVLDVASGASSLYTLYNAAAATSTGSALGAITSSIGAGVGLEGIGAAISSIGSGVDMATAVYTATGYAATAASEAAYAAEVAQIYSSLGIGETASSAATATAAATQATTSAASVEATTAALGTSFGAAMATFGGMLAGAELLAAAFGETGPVSGVLDKIFNGDQSAMTPEEARRGVAYQTSLLSDAAAAAAAGDWAGTVSDDLQVNGLAMLATQHRNIGAYSLASIGGISAEEIDAAVAAMGPYAQALYDVQTITWEVSDALAAYNETSQVGLSGAMAATEQFRAMALELGVTAEQYDALTASGASYDEIAAAVTQTAGDLRIAMLDMAGAVERAAAETGMAAESADVFGSAAAELYNQLAVGTVATGEAEAQLLSLASTMGLDASAANSLADRVENLWAATNAATGGAAGLTSELAGLSDVSSYTSATSKIVSTSIDDMAVALSEATSTANSTSSALGTLASYFSTAAAAASAFDLSGADMVGSANTGYTYHTGGIAGYAGWPRFHTGLLPDEIPAILQRGEPVIRRGAVNAETLPVLRQINQTGTVPQSGGDTFNVTVAPVIQGVKSGDEAVIADRLIRKVEVELRRLQQRRSG